ncbi:beta-L-arabinofuranosidase domain-containing protein [Lentzea sp. NPDC051838]|uniref:beta-L-arabinofuranosidase domain-containing protein n=1 Tax=Lentzea sp. NPDC051838 TaxID=3154849 RepID=UPI003412D69F
MPDTSLRPRIGAVSLLPGPWQDYAARTHAYLRSLDPDRLLHSFRRNAGLPSEVVPCGGCEAPGSALRGHFVGQVLSAWARAFAATGDPACSLRVNYLVQQLALCQDRARFAGYSTGYLSAFPEGVLGEAEARQPAGEPYRALHKIMAGLFDAHVLVGNAQALTVLNRMAAWLGWRLGRLSRAQRRDAVATRSGGMNEVLADLHRLTGDPAHLTTSRYFAPDVARASADWCDTHDLLRRPVRVFRADRGRTRYFDFYEYALHHRPERVEEFSCCHGAVLEAGAGLGDSVYTRTGSTLYVNLFVPSVLTWAGRGLVVRQDAVPGTRLTITGSGRIDLRVRIPSWAAGARMLVNGVEERPVTPGTCARVDRDWIDANVVEVTNLRRCL